MTQHTDLIERLRASSEDGLTPDDAYAAAEALEAATKNPFEAIPHDIPQRMKDAICDETGWSGSMVSRMYTELRKAFTGEPYRANEDLDAALLEVERLSKDAERYAWLRAQPDDCTAPRIDICQWTCEDGDSVNQGNGLRGIAADTAIDEAMKGQP